MLRCTAPFWRQRIRPAEEASEDALEEPGRLRQATGQGARVVSWFSHFWARIVFRAGRELQAPKEARN